MDCRVLLLVRGLNGDIVHICTYYLCLWVKGVYLNYLHICTFKLKYCNKQHMHAHMYIHTCIQYDTQKDTYITTRTQIGMYTCTHNILYNYI